LHFGSLSAAARAVVHGLGVALFPVALSESWSAIFSFIARDWISTLLAAR
jgi:hypothetical protein